jgi:phosphatidate cytidylyltransferase
MLGASLLCLREALGLVNASGTLLPMAVLTTSLYVWAWLDWVSLFTVALPACVLLLPLVGTLGRGHVVQRHPEVPWRILAFLVAVVGPSFLVGVSSFPASGSSTSDSPLVSWQGWLLALVVLTELNDIAQAWWGRALGSRPMAPVLSPRKTWAGLLGGVATTVTVSLVLFPTLTPVGRGSPPGLEDLVSPWVWSALLGGMVSLAGVGGDLAVSLLKRRRGVKDAGDLLPAQGGVLDRFDSLALTAPVYLTLTSLLWIRPW